MKVVLNNDYYQNYGNYFMPNTDYEALYQNENDITVRIKAIIRGKEDKEMITNGSTMYYTEALIDQVIDQNKESDIVKAQEERDYNILSGSAFDEENTKEIALSYLGADTVPSAIYLYPKDFNSKDEITEYLDKYNEGKEEQDQIVLYRYGGDDE